jgi:hypothetical protein
VAAQLVFPKKLEASCHIDLMANPPRSLLREEDLVRYDPHVKLLHSKTHPRRCYLFSDLILETKAEKGKFAVKACLKLPNCIVVDKRYTSSSGLEFDVVSSGEHPQVMALRVVDPISSKMSACFCRH